MATYHSQTVDLLEDFEGSYPGTGWTETDTQNKLSTSVSALYEGSYGLLYDYTGTPPITAWVRYEIASNQSPISVGFWIYTPGMPDYGGLTDWVGFRDDLDNDTMRFCIGKNSGTNNYECAVRAYTGTFSSAISLSAATWYWVTIKITKNGDIVLRVYNTSQTQVGSEVTVATGAYDVRLMRFGALDLGSGVTSNLYFDSIVADWTTAAYPLYGWDTVTNQYARPAADRADGTWTNEASSNVNLYASIDEETANDADYIRSAAAPTNDTCTVDLSAISTPVAGTVTMRIRARFL